MNKPVHALRRGRAMARIALALAAFAISGIASADVGLAAVSGAGQIAVTGESFPMPLVARVSDADGAPVAGIDVTFQAPDCPNDGTVCVTPSGYPRFEGDVPTATVTTDADGVATSPAMIAGDQAIQVAFTAKIGSDASRVEVSYPVLQVASLDAVPITSAFTGSWYDPAQSGHGLFVEVLPDDRFVAYWYAFTPPSFQPGSGQQAWFGGSGPIVGNQAIVTADRAVNGGWVTDFDPASVTRVPWGTLTFTFQDCNHGRVDYIADDPEWGSGHVDLTRLTMPAGLACP